MAHGPGKYDPICTVVREETGADAVVVIVVNGKLGTGLSVQGPAWILKGIPEVLRRTADEVEADIGKAD